MKRHLIELAVILAFAVLVLVTMVEAGTYTFTVGAPQDAYLARLLDKVNVGRMAQQQAPFADVEAFLRDVLVNAVKGWSDELDKDEMKTACSAFKALSGAEKNQIRTALGGKSPCL